MKVNNERTKREAELIQAYAEIAQLQTQTRKQTINETSYGSELEKLKSKAKEL